MERDTLTIVNRLGLHARAASRFVSVSSQFSSRIRVRKDGDWVDGKSIMAVMMLAAAKGSELELEVDGKDEARAIAALRDLVEDYFGEGG